MDKYFTISNVVETSIKVKGSDFIAKAKSVTTIEEAMEFIKEIKSKHFDANHNCFAYKIGASGNEYRYSDDGEPSGTAGKPIYFMLNKFDFSDIVLVVTRYFGGTKLGVGGLVRAYSDSAEEALKLATPKTIYLTKKVIIECTYNDIALIKRLMDKYAITFSENYDESVHFEIDVLNSKVDEFKQIVFEKSNSRLKAIEIE